MNEKPNSMEKKAEHIPTPEEVLDVLKRMVEGECRETQRLFDEEGNLYRLDAITEGTEEGETLEFFYIRKGSYPNGDKALETEIHSIYVPRGPVGPQASLIDGTWKIINKINK